MRRRGAFPAAACWAMVVVAVWGGRAPALDLLVNGAFETKDGLGWTEWHAEWGAVPTYDYAAADGPLEGASSLHQSAPRGSFGVYQEICVEVGKPVQVGWAWKGSTSGDGWWEVLIVDAPYSYDAVDNPAGHPETFLASKWEAGLGGDYPEPSAEWTSEASEFTPTSDVITVVLKCGSTKGDRIEAWFDAVKVAEDTAVLEIGEVVPPLGKTAGGDAIRVRGRVFPEGSAVAFGVQPAASVVRGSTCELRVVTPPGGPGRVDVAVTVPGGSVTLSGGFRYVPPPTVASITPAAGPVEGGTEVTIRGDSFAGLRAGDIKVLVGSKALKGIQVPDETTITGTTPAGEAGPADVSVTTPFGSVTAAGGFTYGTQGPTFVRGDCDGDGAINITDGISLLGFLFLGAGAPPCLEACNPDGGREINISDGIAILNFLFIGGPAPVAPYPECGADGTAEVTCDAAQTGCL